MAFPNDDRSRLSVVIPAYNEGPSIAGVVEGARRVVPEAEILVVDDGSSDDTASQAERAGARVLRFAENRGKGQALRAGIREARGDVLLFIDADGQDDPSEIHALLAALTPDVAMVIGSRFRGRLLEGSITRLNHAGNRALTWLFNRIYASGLTDTQAGFRVLRRSALEVDELRASRYEIETELTLHVLQRGGRVVEVPVTRAAREAGASGFNVPYHGLRILSWMVAGRIRYARSHRRNRHAAQRTRATSAGMP